MELKNGLNLTIAKAIKEDAQMLIEYLNLVGGESDNLLFGANEFQMSVEDEIAFIERLSTSITSALFVSKIGDEIVSVGSIMSAPRKRIAHQADIAISVKKKYWNLGIGTAMMNELIGFAKGNNITEIIHLGVNSDNVNAINLYKKLGFVEIGRYENFFKFNDSYGDEILMNLYL